jgi:hypothetical protein
MKILVTGCLGSLASELVPYLRSEKPDLQIDGVDTNWFTHPTNFSHYPSLLTDYSKILFKNYCDLSIEELRPYDEVIHLAGPLPGIPEDNRKLIMLSVYDGPLELYRKSIQAGVRRVTLFSFFDPERKVRSESSRSNKISASKNLYQHAEQMFFNDATALTINQPESTLFIRLPELCGVSRHPRLDNALNLQCYEKELALPLTPVDFPLQVSSYRLIARQLSDIILSRSTGGNFDIYQSALQIKIEEFQKILSETNDSKEKCGEALLECICKEMSEFRLFIRSLAHDVLLTPRSLHRQGFTKTLISLNFLSDTLDLRTPDVGLNAEDAVNRALVLVSEAKPQEARTLLHQAALSGRHIIDLYHTLAMTYLQEGNNRAASMALATELQFFPGNQEAQTLFGEVQKLG